MGRMNDYKKLDKMKYFTAFLLTIIIFSAGVLLGNYITSQKLDTITNIEDKIRLETMGAEIQHQILIGNPCQFINSTPLTEQLYSLSEKLDHLENIYGEDDENVLKLKEQYSLLQVRHWLYTRQTNKECSVNNVPIIYFYSNEGDCNKCEEQGYVLTYMRKKYPDLRVYSFDINMDNPAINTIKDIYNVKQAPVVIVDSIVYPNFMTRDNLEEAIQLENVTSR